MKNFIGIVCLISWFCLGFSDEDTVVKNGLKPAGKAITFEFKQDLKFGGGEEGTQLWVGPNVSVSVNSKGHIFICDPSEFRILEFDSDGTLVKSIGGQGQGPGEFQNLQGFSILADDSAISLDILGGVGKLQYFTPDMSYDRQIPTTFGTMLQTIVPSPTGNLLFSMYVELNPQTGQMAICAGILDENFNRINELTKKERSAPDFQRFSEGAYWSEYLGENMRLTQQRGIAHFTPSGRVLTALSDEYKIQIWDSTAKKLEKTVVRQFKPIPQGEDEIMATTEPVRETIIQALPAQFKDLITDNVVRKAIELAEFPPYKTPIFGLIPLPDEGFLVVHDISQVDHTSRADIFSPEGKYLGQFTLPHLAFGGMSGSPRWIFTDTHAYVLDLTDDSENVLIRYAYRRAPM